MYCIVNLNTMFILFLINKSKFISTNDGTLPSNIETLAIKFKDSNQ